MSIGINLTVSSYTFYEARLPLIVGLIVQSASSKERSSSLNLARSPPQKVPSSSNEQVRPIVVLQSQDEGTSTRQPSKKTLLEYGFTKERPRLQEIHRVAISENIMRSRLPISTDIDNHDIDDEKPGSSLSERFQALRTPKDNVSNLGEDLNPDQSHQMVSSIPIDLKDISEAIMTESSWQSQESSKDQGLRLTEPPEALEMSTVQDDQSLNPISDKTDSPPSNDHEFADPVTKSHNLPFPSLGQRKARTQSLTSDDGRLKRFSSDTNATRRMTDPTRRTTEKPTAILVRRGHINTDGVTQKEATKGIGDTESEEGDLAVDSTKNESMSINDTEAKEDVDGTWHPCHESKILKCIKVDDDGKSKSPDPAREKMDSDDDDAVESVRGPEEWIALQGPISFEMHDSCCAPTTDEDNSQKSKGDK